MLYARYYIIFAKVLQNNIRTIQSKLEEETKAKAVAQDHIIAANHRYTHTHTNTNTDLYVEKMVEGKQMFDK